MIGLKGRSGYSYTSLESASGPISTRGTLERAPESEKFSSDPPSSRDLGEARRILVVDDNPTIHHDFQRLLGTKPRSSTVSDIETALFGSESRPPASTVSPGHFDVESAMHGQAALSMVTRRLRGGQPYALAFVDMRMPGWDGVETIVRILSEDPAIEIVICSAYSDYSWHEVIRRVNRPGLRLLKKPFESREVLELAWSLTGKWLRARAASRPQAR